MTKFVPCDKKCDKNGTKCQNMHKYTILCIKMNNYTENLSQIGQKLDKDVTNWGQKLEKFCHNKCKM